MDEISGHQGLKFPFIQIGVHALDLQAALREGARFVEADHVAVGEIFKRMQFPQRPMLMSSTSPFGSIPRRPAEVATTAASTGVPRWKTASANSSTPSGTIRKPVNLVTFFIELSSSEPLPLAFLT